MINAQELLKELESDQNVCVLQPLGHNVLIEIKEFVSEKKTDTGIIVSHGNTAKREHVASDIGVVIALGPRAFTNAAACDRVVGVEKAATISEVDHADPYGVVEVLALQSDAHERGRVWGLQVGDIVEFPRYGGNIPALSNCRHEKHLQNYRLIPDTEIRAVIHLQPKEA